MHILLQQFILLSVLAVVFYFLPLKQKKKDFVYMVIAFIPMWYIHSMVKVGSVPDLDNYFYMFVQTKNMSWRDCFLYVGSMEAGFVILNKLVSLITTNYYVFQGLYGFIFLIIFFNSFRRYSPYAIISVLLLLVGSYNISIYVIRQYLAAAIFVASFPLILQRKMIPFLLICLLNFFIHKTAIICVPVYFMYQLKPKLLILSGLTIALLVFVSSEALMFFTIESLGDYEEYLTGHDYGGQRFVGTAIVAVIFILYIYYIRGKIWEDNIHKLVFVLLLLDILVNIVIIGRPGTMYRLTSFFDTATLFALPLIMNTKNNMVEKILVCSVVLFLKVYPTFFGSNGMGDLMGMRFIG